jgi:hypothetical protein
MGDWCGSKKDRHRHHMKNRVQIKEETRRGGPEITLREII